MQQHNQPPSNSLPKIYCKDTDINSFIKVTKYLKPLPISVMDKLAKRFSVAPEHIVILIELAAKGGGFIWN